MKISLQLLLLIAFIIGTVYSAQANDCNTSNLISSEEDFADSQVAGSLAGAGYSGLAQCAGPDNRDDVWYRFVAVATKHGVRATGTGDLSLTIEVYDACGGNLLACQSGGASVTAALGGLTPGNTYYYRVYHSGPTDATSDAFTTSVAHIPFVELISSDCGVLDYTTNDIIRATDPSNTENFTNYQFRFVELEPPFNTYIITSPNLTNPNFRLQWFPQLEYGRTYSVSVRVKAILPTYGDFGNECVIGLQEQVKTSELEAQYVNGFFGFCDWIGARGVGLATKYRWRFLNLGDLSVTTALGDNNQRLLRLSSVPGLQLGETYIVSVFVTVAGEESPEGALKFINMNNFVPNTGIRQDIYTCGATYPISSDIQAREICNADSYTWRFRNTSQAQPDLLYTRTGGNRFIKLNWVTGLNVGDSYDVDIRATQGGLIGDYSAVCNITIGASLNPNLLLVDDYILASEDHIEEVPVLDLPVLEATSGQTWEMTVHPEFTGGSDYIVTFSDADADQEVLLEVYDVNGRLVSKENVNILAGSRISQRLDGLTPGIYLVRAASDTRFETGKITVF